MVKLCDICADDFVAYLIFQFSPSAGIKLLRARLLSTNFTPEKICTLAAAASSSPKFLADTDAARKWLMTMQKDCTDELLVSGLLVSNCPTSLLCITAARNFLGASALLLERGADLHHTEVRRGRRRGLVDIAAHAGGLDDDWKLVLYLLKKGALPISPQGVLFTPLRQGNIDVARTFLNANVKCDKDGFSALLCDMCSHGQLPSIKLLLDEVGVPVNALNPRDGLTGTDRALAWHRWVTAEWLISQRQGMPSQKEMALGNLMDASDEACALRVLDLLLSRMFFNMHDVLSSVVQRGDLNLCQHLLGRDKIEGDVSLLPSGCPPALVDQALCHGHLRIARLLLLHGIKPRNPARCRSDAALHGGSCHQVTAEILQLLPAALRRVDTAVEERLPAQHTQNCAAEHMASETDAAEFSGADSDGLALVPLCGM